MAKESAPQGRFGYLHGNGNFRLRRPEDKTTYQLLQEQLRAGQIQPASPEALAKKQIEQLSQDPLLQAEQTMRARGHRVKERKHRRRKDPPPSQYERRMFGIKD